MSRKKIAAKISEDYKMVRSLAISVPQYEKYIELIGMEYSGKKEDGFASEKQINFLTSFGNVDYYSKKSLAKGNKWFMNACIAIAKDNPNQDFFVKVS